MSYKVNLTSLNATTIDILNTIRANASAEYADSIPVVTTAMDIPNVGQTIMGVPSFQNEFLEALINRIALVVVRSVTFNNPYKNLKKGYLSYGETVEEIFVNIVQAYDYNPEKGASRELKRYLPDVKSVFHVINYKAVYPVTISEDELATAFLSADGVTSLITKIIDSVYKGVEYDEYLLFKYMLIKNISSGKFKPVSIGDGTDLNKSASAIKGVSNKFRFVSKNFNQAGVRNNSTIDNQAIFMDSDFNASFDVEVLASAFNMDKANFMGKLYLIDDWTTFDNERFDVIRENSTGIEEVTEDELALMENVKCALLDENWFQVYDNKNKFTEKYIASNMEWNYFYHIWKTISYSPYENAVVFCLDSATTALPATINVSVDSVSTSDTGNVICLAIADTDTLSPTTLKFIQTETLTEAGIGVHPYGAYLIPPSQKATQIQIVAEIDGATYTNTTTKITTATAIGTKIALTKQG